jgi:hypothetical protein
MDTETNPAAAVVSAVEDCLELAASWLAWDGRPRVSEDGDRIYTPHKAVRRIARTFEHRLASAGAAAWDSPRTPNWTLREIAEHLTGVRWYAEQVGRLA